MNNVQAAAHDSSTSRSLGYTDNRVGIKRVQSSLEMPLAIHIVIL